jgi:hypothetical protein
MGVLSFLAATRRKTQVAPQRSPEAYSPKPTVDAALEKIEARFGDVVAPAGERIREAFTWHRTGRKADAFMAFHAMLADASLVSDPLARIAVEGEIFARLRRCYEREGCFSPALVEAAMGYAARAKSFAAEGQEDALAQMRDADFFDRYFKPLLDRARLAHASVKFRALVEAQLKTLPMIDMTELRVALDQFQRNPPQPPKREVERVAGQLYIAELHGT